MSSRNNCRVLHEVSDTNQQDAYKWINHHKSVESGEGAKIVVVLEESKNLSYMKLKSLQRSLEACELRFKEKEDERVKRKLYNLYFLKLTRRGKMITRRTRNVKANGRTTMKNKINLIMRKTIRKKVSAMTKRRSINTKFNATIVKIGDILQMSARIEKGQERRMTMLSLFMIVVQIMML